MVEMVEMGEMGAAAPILSPLRGGRRIRKMDKIGARRPFRPAGESRVQVCTPYAREQEIARYPPEGAIRE
jgi:hypothetical protein